jgi:hypothetical protein
MRHSALSVCLLLGLAGCAAEAPSGSPVPITPVGAFGESGVPDANRQIIHRATLSLVVDDFGITEKQVAELVRSTCGYVAQFGEDRPYGAQRGGRWTVRVPVPQFERFLEEVGKLGVAEQRERHADDVTEEFVDLTARLKNKQQLEARLLELVAKRADEIKDVIAVEAELARVREEIERMQGRLRYLTDRVALTTVEIRAYERRDYRPTEATFTGRIAHTFWQSLDMLRSLAEACVLLLVALVPWFVALLAFAVPFAWLIRRLTRRTAVPASA